MSFPVFPVLTKDVTVHRNEKDFLISHIGDEVVLMDVKDGRYISVNQVGSNIWNLMERPVTISSIITTLIETYDIEEEQCEHETLAFLNKIQEHNMLIVL